MRFCENLGHSCNNPTEIRHGTRHACGPFLHSRGGTGCGSNHNPFGLFQ